jgi:hypothetical protein
MIDFGACGVFSDKDRRVMRRMNELYDRGDVAGMVDCALALMEPLPLADIDSFKRDLLDAWWKGYYGLQSRHSEWWERTSVGLWMAMLNLFRKYEISMPSNMVRMCRATLLFETLAAQLYPRINVFREFNKYARQAGLAARKQLICCALHHALTGPDPVEYSRLREAAYLGNDVLFRVQEFLGSSHFTFLAVMDKIYFAIDYFFNVLKVAMISGAGVWFVYLIGYKWFGSWRSATWSWPLRIMVGAWTAVALLNIFSFGRQTMKRWSDKDNYNDRLGVSV